VARLHSGYALRDGTSHRKRTSSVTSLEREGKFGKFTGAGTGDLVNVEIPGHGTWLVDIKTMNKVEFEQGAREFTMKKWQAKCHAIWIGSVQTRL
jgi:hypothetical protein